MTEIERTFIPEVHIKDVDASKLKLNIIPSGFESLDSYGLLKEGRSELIIVGGRPSHGKSAFMFQIARNVSKGTPVHVFSLEMDKESILTRLIASDLNTSITNIQTGYVGHEEIKRAHARYTDLNYYIDDRGGLDVGDIILAAKQAYHRIGTGLIIVDYLQLLRSKRGNSRDDEIGVITGELKKLAKDLKVPIIVGSQLNRDCERRATEDGVSKPKLSDLRDSGNIEQDADMVLFVHRESRINGRRPGEADIVIAKNRNGAVGNIVMGFSESQTRFYDMGYL